MRSLVLAGLLAAALAAPAAAQKTFDIPAEDRPVPGRLQDLYAVGQLEGRDCETFADVRQAAFDAKHNFYVLDGGVQRVLVFDAHGRFVRQVARAAAPVSCRRRSAWRSWPTARSWPTTWAGRATSSSRPVASSARTSPTRRGTWPTRRSCRTRPAA